MSLSSAPSNSLDSGSSEDVIGEPVSSLYHKARTLIFTGLDREPGKDSYEYVDQGRSVQGSGYLDEATRARSILPSIGVPFTETSTVSVRYGRSSTVMVRGLDIDPILIEAAKIRAATDIDSY